MSVAPAAGLRSFCIVAALVAGGACKRNQHLAEGPPLRAEYIDAGRPMMPPDPAAMARAMAAADASVRAMPPGVPGAQPVPAVPVAPPVVDAGVPSMAPIVVVDAGTATPEAPAPPAGRRRRRRH
ncbi:MAG: hypothetical protein U0326_08690 [Polyangiales bacterium]